MTLALDFDVFAVLLLLAPFALACVAPLLSDALGRAAGWVLAIVPAGLFAALASLLPGIAAGTPVRIGMDWVPALDLRFAVFIDGLSLTFALLITGIGALIVVYAGEYLGGHPRRGRFFASLLAFLGAMLGLVLADSLVALFAFWELTAVASFLLIGFDHERRAARRAAFQALMVTSLGGLALLAGGVLLQVVAHTWLLSEMASSAELHRAGWAYPWVLGLMVVAAFTKSAQIPFHVWLPNAMQAPTPVSAFLHSATMVQAGVYLLSRLSPLLAGTPLWQGLLCGFGGATLLWGAIVALRQTDLKQMLAHTTIAALGLLVLLLGIGGAHAAAAVAAYFVAHALYKAALFLVVGALDHGTGTRDIRVLSGLRDRMPIAFIAAGAAAISMFGLPPALGYLAKEQMFAAVHAFDLRGIAVLAALVLGNGMMGAVALAMLRPFLGPLKPTPQTPHDGAIALWLGPVLLGLCSIGVVFVVGSFGDLIVRPMAAALVPGAPPTELGYGVDLRGPALWLSLASWGLAAAIYWRLDRLRDVLVRIEHHFIWSVDRGFDRLVSGLLHMSAATTRIVQNGRLELYLVVLFCALALTLVLPLASGAAPSMPKLAPLTFYEWGTVALTVAGIVAVVLSPTRLGAIVALGVQGLALALVFIFFGAPDLGFTQLLVEVLSVVILTLVMTRLRLTPRDPRPLEDWLRDGALALICGASVTALLLRVVQGAFDGRLSRFFADNSLAVAHGRNIVNVILVDFRGLDTLGEITVVMTAGIAVLALLRRQQRHGRPVDPAAGTDPGTP